MTVQYEIFGDESKCGHIIAYGFIGINPNNLDRAIEAIAAVKQKYGGDENAELHCRSLFAGDNRARSAWAHLTGHQPYYLCHEIAKAMREIGVNAIASITDKRGLPKRMDLSFSDGQSEPKIMGHELDDKQIQQYLYSAGTAYLAMNVGMDKVKIWVDEDKTKIDWFNGKRQAKNLHDFIKPAGFDPGKYKPLLEVADLYAYATARVHAKDRRMRVYFKMIYNCFKTVVLTYKFEPDKWGSM